MDISLIDALSKRSRIACRLDVVSVVCGSCVSVLCVVYVWVCVGCVMGVSWVALGWLLGDSCVGRAGSWVGVV